MSTPSRAVTFDLGGTLVEYEYVPREELEATGWRGLYRRLRAGDRFRRAIFADTLRQLGDIPPECAAHVGDRIVDDVRGAQGVGMKRVLKAYPRRVPVPGVRPDAGITTLAELPAALDALFPE